MEIQEASRIPPQGKGGSAVQNIRKEISIKNTIPKWEGKHYSKCEMLFDGIKRSWPQSLLTCIYVLASMRLIYISRNDLFFELCCLWERGGWVVIVWVSWPQGQWFEFLRTEWPKIAHQHAVQTDCQSTQSSATCSRRALVGSMGPARKSHSKWLFLV